MNSSVTPMKTLQLGGLVCALSASVFAVAAERSEKVQAEIDTISQYLDSHPEMAIDFRDVSGEFCFNTWMVGGGHMTHYAVDPASTREDMIDFVRADSLGDGLDVDKLPRFPGKLGAMEPNNWYYLPAWQFEPHHGTRFPFALLLRATNIQ